MIAVSIDDIRVRMGSRTILKGATADFPAATLTGIVGPNGAGKTTMLRAALGLLPLSGGTVRLLNKPLPAWRRLALARTAAYLPQASESQWPMPVYDVVMLGRLPHRNRFAPPSPADETAVEDALSRCDAASFLGRRMNELSAGERARVLLARALSTQAPILMADEPAAFLDPAHQFALMALLQNEARRGAAVLVTLHDLSLAMDYCDRLIVVDGGCVVAGGMPSATLTDEVLGQVFGLADAGHRHFRRFKAIKNIMPTDGRP